MKFQQPLPAERARIKEHRRALPEDIDAHVNTHGHNLAGMRRLVKQVMRAQADILARLDKLKS